MNVRFFEGYAIFDGDEGAFALRDGLMPDDVLALADHGRLRPDLVIADQHVKRWRRRSPGTRSSMPIPVTPAATTLQL